MKKMNFKNILFSAALAAGAMSLASCSLEEENPGGFTMENMAENSVESYQTLLNQCYFGMERFLYGTDGFMELTEGDTDLWTYQGNQNTSYTQYFWFFAGAAPNTTYTMVSGTLSMMVLAVAIWLSVWQIKPLLKLRLKEMSKLQKLDSCVLSIISML